ncbi:MAG: alanine racemase [Planctomycetota bacterium]|nr:alanine racemase [Planctomycetota bacterium]
MVAESTIRIEVDALEANLGAVARHMNRDLEALCAVVKADAYGLGAARLAYPQPSQGLPRFAAYGLSEAIEVGDAAPGADVIVLMPVRELRRDARTLALLGSQRLHFTAHQLGQVEALEADAVRLGVVLPLHLEFDCGMGRGGCVASDAMDVLELVAASPRLRLAGVMTHLPDAVDDPISAIERGRDFERMIDAAGTLIPADVVRHVAATASLESGSLHFDQARVGLAWVGHGPQVLAGRPDPMPLRPILSWWSRIVQVRRLAAGSTVGYGCTFATSRETLTGLVPVGYADGLPATPGSEPHRVVVHGKRGPIAVPVLGRMNMDQCVIDLTEVGPIEETIAVEVISADADSPVSLDRVAARAGVLPYQLLCGISPRIPRLLVTGGDAVSPQARTLVTDLSGRDSRRLAEG